MMRLLSLLSLTALLSSPAFAADLGTYRPGTPYHSVVAPGADVCESQCSGDAQCRGWNYVKANPAAPGVCEFISNVSAPVASSISISGIGSGGSFGNRVMQGGSNTVRVGTRVTPKPQSNVTRVGNRNVVRKPVPQRVQSQPTSTRRVVRPAQAQARPQVRQQPRPQQRPQFRPMLDGAAPYPQQQAPQGYLPQQAPRAVASQRREPARRRGQSSRPPIGQAIAAPQAAPQMPRPQQPQPQQMMPRASARTPVNGTAAVKQRQAALIAQSRMQSQGLTAEQAQQSLYGSLYDDVRAPAANTAVPSDPNAPIPTSTSRPTVPVQIEGLAGAARRP